jgi:hypothetical protein
MPGADDAWLTGALREAHIFRGWTVTMGRFIGLQKWRKVAANEPKILVVLSDAPQVVSI